MDRNETQEGQYHQHHQVTKGPHENDFRLRKGMGSLSDKLPQGNETSCTHSQQGGNKSNE